MSITKTAKETFKDEGNLQIHGLGLSPCHGPHNLEGLGHQGQRSPAVDSVCG